jgi:hypothetical protein
MHRGFNAYVQWLVLQVHTSLNMSYFQLKLTARCNTKLKMALLAELLLKFRPGACRLASMYTDSIFDFLKDNLGVPHNIIMLYAFGTLSRNKPDKPGRFFYYI